MKKGHKTKNKILGAGNMGTDHIKLKIGETFKFGIFKEYMSHRAI